MALHGKYNSDYAACLKNAENFLVAQTYKINMVNMVTLMSSWYNLLKHMNGNCTEQGADGEVLYYHTCGKHIPHEEKKFLWNNTDVQVPM